MTVSVDVDCNNGTLGLLLVVLVMVILVTLGFAFSSRILSFKFNYLQLDNYFIDEAIVWNMDRLMAMMNNSHGQMPKWIYMLL